MSYHPVNYVAYRVAPGLPWQARKVSVFDVAQLIRLHDSARVFASMSDALAYVARSNSSEEHLCTPLRLPNGMLCADRPSDITPGCSSQQDIRTICVRR